MFTAISYIINIVLLIVILKIIHQSHKAFDAEKFKAQKFFSMFKLVNMWLEAKQAGKSIERMLLEYGYSTVAVYGFHYIGERLVEELKDSQIKVLYAIDKNIDGGNLDLKIYKPDEKLPEVDLIIVASTVFYYEMRSNLASKVGCPIISIEEVVERMI